MNLQGNRIKELDLLRGIAIILVLFRHVNVNQFLFTMGWIGVDLFFVLSGFLVGGLIFNEIKTFGNFNVKLFLIRRGFKIYPLYFLTYPLYLILRIDEMGFDKVGFISDMIFVQNYIWGFGYAYPASWSLAIEEHFYFLLSISLWICCKREFFNLNFGLFSKRFIYSMITVMVLCLFLRLIFNMYYFSKGSNLTQLFTYTHLRIDSLLFGVFLAYFYNYNYTMISSFYKKYKNILIIIIILGISWTPFLDSMNSFFVKTIGFTILYLSFGSLIMLVIINKDIMTPKSKLLIKIENFVCSFGVSSYAIYIIHTFVIKVVERGQLYFSFLNNQFVYFILCFSFSYVLGILLTKLVENKFLSWRNKFFPSRSIGIKTN